MQSSQKYCLKQNRRNANLKIYVKAGNTPITSLKLKLWKIMLPPVTVLIHFPTNKPTVTQFYSALQMGVDRMMLMMQLLLITTLVTVFDDTDDGL